MVGNKSLLMLIIICILSLGFMILIGGTESNPSTVEINETGNHIHVPLPESEVRSRTVNISLPMNTEAFQVIKRWNDQFVEEYPEIEVELNVETETPSFQDYRTNLLLGQSPDILWIPNAWVNELASTGYLQSLDEWFKSDEQALFLHTMMAQVRWNSYLWGIPSEVDPYGLVWNRGALEEIGLDVSALTFEQLVVALQEIELDEQIVWQWKADDPMALANLYFVMGDFVEQIMPSEFDSFSWDRINNEEVDFMVAKYTDYRKHAAQGIEFRPLFHGQAPWLELLPGKSFAITSQSEVIEEAWSWIQFMSQEKIQDELMEAGLGIPAMVESTTAPDWAENFHHKELPKPMVTMKTIEEIQIMSESLWQGQINFSEYSQFLDSFQGVLDDTNS